MRKIKHVAKPRLNVSFFFILIFIITALFVVFQYVNTRSVHAEPPSGGFGIIGDSNADEYRSNDNRGGAYSSTTFNFVELLANNRQLNFGPWGEWGEPRRSGYKYNWGRSAARMADMIASGQHTGLAEQIRSGEVKYVFISLGGNDFHIHNGTYQEVYNWSLNGQTAQIQNKVDQMIADFTLALDTVEAAGPTAIVIANTGDPGLHPAFSSIFPDVNGRAGVSDAINQFNAAVLNLATTRNIGFFDQHAWGLDLWNNRRDAQGYINVGGELINTNGKGDEPHNFQLGDSVGHLGTVANGLAANEWFIAPFNQRYQMNLVPFTEEEILTNAGILTQSPTPSLTDIPSVTNTPIPTITNTPTPTNTPTLIPTSTPTSIPTLTPTHTPTPTIPYTPQTIYPKSFQVTTGSLQSGNVASLTSDNNSFLVVKSSSSGYTRTANTDINAGNLTNTNPLSLEVSVRIKGSTSQSLKIFIYDYSNATWELVDSSTLKNSEVLRKVTVLNTNNHYANALGQVGLRINSSKLTLNTYTHSIDMVKIIAQ